MKFSGDFPSHHKKLIEELQILEAWFAEHGSDIARNTAAKGMTAMAHDYYVMDIEEEGDRLLYKAEKLCPNYFTGPIYVHMRNDKDFYQLIQQIKPTLGYDIMTELGFLDEQI